jgi:hypothetical protein
MKKTTIILALFATLSLQAQTSLNTGATASTQTTTSFSATDLTTFLVNLRSEIQQTLPFISAFNNSFDFASTGASGLAVSNGISAAVAGTPVVVSVNNQNLAISRDALRELVVLQTDLQRVLANLNALTASSSNLTSSSSSGIVPGKVPGAFTGLFGGLTNQFSSPLTNGFTAPLTGPTGLGTTR